MNVKGRVVQITIIFSCLWALNSQSTTFANTVSTAQHGSWDTIEIRFCNAEGSTLLSGWIADTPHLRARGYQGSPRIDAILFVWESPQVRRFWMKNTEIPLDLWHLDELGRITEHYPLSPLSEQIIESRTQGRFSIETPSYRHLSSSYVPGDYVIWDGSSCPAL